MPDKGAIEHVNQPWQREFVEVAPPPRCPGVQLEFALFTGLRRGEVFDLTWERVDRARGVILLVITKSGKRREVPLNSPADAVFGTSKWDHFCSVWEGAVDRADLVDFHFHDLRHTFASWAVQRGASLQELKPLLGHHSLAMTLRYGHRRPSTSAQRSPGSTLRYPPRIQPKLQHKRPRSRRFCSRSSCFLLVRLAGVEPATLGLEIRCSVQLSYRRIRHLRYTNGLMCDLLSDFLGG